MAHRRTLWTFKGRNTNYLPQKIIVCELDRALWVEIRNSPKLIRTNSELNKKEFQWFKENTFTINNEHCTKLPIHW